MFSFVKSVGCESLSVSFCKSHDGVEGGRGAFTALLTHQAGIDTLLSPLSSFLSANANVLLFVFRCNAHPLQLLSTSPLEGVLCSVKASLKIFHVSSFKTLIYRDLSIVRPHLLHFTTHFSSIFVPRNLPSLPTHTQESRTQVLIFLSQKAYCKLPSHYSFQYVDQGLKFAARFVCLKAFDEPAHLLCPLKPKRY